MKKSKQNNFFADFIAQEMYLQNPPMTTDKFIDFCKKRGIQITKEELKFFEKEKLFIPIESKKEIKLYSSFQIYWLNILKKSFLITINLAGDDIESHKEYFDLDTKKKKLGKNHEEFNIILKFLLSVQFVYFPYVKSGGGTIQITGDDKKWQEARHNFKLDEVLKKLDLKVEDIAKWYKIFLDEAQKILGIKRDDWVQLWKNIAWNEKDKLEGNIRLGVEYLQWSVMLKMIIEEHLQKEILDIDEMLNISSDDILKFEPEQMNQYGVLLRATRNKRYSDKYKNYYQDHYKRLFYLSNDFGLDYQPRVMVFVEGKTEKTVFSEIFEQYIGNKPENLGIELVNIKGISQFFGPKLLIPDLEGKKKKIFISNFNHLISYNLNKWQIVPFFIGDNEGSDEKHIISHLLQNGLSISFNQKPYTFPKDWQYIWGIANDNKPFQGKDFEMANFSDNEIAKVLSEILNKKIQSSSVQVKRKANQGIKQIDQDTEKNGNKVKIAKKLIKNLFDEYEKAKDNKLFERPIFKAIDRITKLAVLNHPPVDREVELKNKEYIEKELRKMT